MGRKTWLALPKVEGANRTAKLRDVDLGNTSRRILAKMLYNVLHEVGVTELHEAQQEFLQSRDILNNTTELLRVFGDAVTKGNCKERRPMRRERARHVNFGLIPPPQTVEHFDT